MKYLLDTNVFIFMLTQNYNRLSKQQVSVLTNPKNKFLVSEASLYEIGIKVRMGKSDFLHINMSKLETDRKNAGIKLLKSKINHYTNIPNVPVVMGNNNKPHADPFDLLILSQTMTENLSILSTDAYFPDYSSINVIS